VDDHTAGSECSVLIHYSHNSHSLSNYPVDVALEVVDHGHVSLGYEHPRFYCAFNSHSAYAKYHRSGTEFLPLQLCHGHPVQCTAIRYC